MTKPKYATPDGRGTTSKKAYLREWKARLTSFAAQDLTQAMARIEGDSYNRGRDSVSFNERYGEGDY